MMNLNTSHHRGTTRLDVLAGMSCAAVIGALTLPGLAGARGASQTTQSNANLGSHGFAHALYAAEWNGALPSYIDHDISAYGNSVATAFDEWSEAHSGPGSIENHPPITLGWGPLPGGQTGLYQYSTTNDANASLTVPINFDAAGGNPATVGLGSFRFANARGYRSYLATTFYAPVFYAPTDPVVLPLVEPGYDSPWEYAALEPSVPGLGDVPYFTSYSFSPAAMFHPDVMANPSAGGWTDPWSIDHGFRSPGLFDARYANLKTLMIEHHWLQDAPAEPCNPAFDIGIYDGCEPYYFNHGMASAPNSLFFDLSVRELPNTEVAAADQALLKKTGYGLWSRDTPFGSNGYYNDLSYDTTDLAHHIFTTDGILGRDTLSR